MSASESLLSKVIDENAVDVFTRLALEESHFPTEAERKAYRFIVDYAQSNGNQAPSYATFVGENPEIHYIPAITDSFEYLTRKIKDAAGKRSIAEFFETEIAPLFESRDTETFISELQSRLDAIKMKYRTSVRIGTNVTEEFSRFLEEYRARKAGQSFRIWRSKFPSINREIGGYFSGNTYTWYARSGRGKSVVVMEEALESAFQGATVLIWALEMSAFEWMARAYTSISARQGLLTAEIDGTTYDAGFETRALLGGRLPAEYEAGLETFASTLADAVPGRIILRAVDDIEFRDRSLKRLEADILETKADVVVVDPFYYLDYEANTSRTTGGDAANTSRKLRHLAGMTKAVIHVITQADENGAEKDDGGVRELKPPKRAEIKKTKAVLEDAANVFGIDTLAHDGRGVIEIGKGRNGGEDARIELVYLPNYGIVRELETGAAIAGQFKTQF